MAETLTTEIALALVATAVQVPVVERTPTGGLVNHLLLEEWGAVLKDIQPPVLPLESGMGAVAATADQEAAPVLPAAAPLGLTEALYPRPVLLLAAVEAPVVPATVQVLVGGMEVRRVEVQATLPVLSEAEEDMDRTELEVVPPVVEALQGDIRVPPVEPTVLHKVLQVEGDIPMAPLHKIVNPHPVDPATVKDTIPSWARHLIETETERNC